MTDQELKDLIASFAVTHEKSVAEADRRFARLEEQFARTDARLEKSAAETDRRFAQLKEQFARTDARLEKSAAESAAEADRRFALLKEQSAETDAQLAKTDAQPAETDAQLKRVAEMVGGIANNQGQVAEEFFYHSLTKCMQVANIQFDVVYRNLGGHIKGLQDEFDLILVNGDTLAMFEVKTKAHVSLVDTMLQRKIPNLRKVLPCFTGYKIYAGIASLVTYDELIEQTKKQGLFLLTQQGDHLEVVNKDVTCF